MTPISLPPTCSEDTNHQIPIIYTSLFDSLPTEILNNHPLINSAYPKAVHVISWYYCFNAFLVAEFIIF